MEKSVQIIVTVDDVPMASLEQLLAEIEAAVEEYEYKRLDVSLRDTPSIRPPTQQQR